MIKDLVNIKICENINIILHRIMIIDIILIIICFISIVVDNNIILYIFSSIMSIFNIMYVLFLRKQSEILKEIDEEDKG